MGLTWAPLHTPHPVCGGTLTPVPSVAVRYFLKNKVSPDLCNEDGLTALHQVRPGSPAPCFPPGQVPHLPVFFCPEPTGRRVGRGATAAPFERLLSASEMCVSVADMPTEPLCTLTHSL